MAGRTMKRVISLRRRIARSLIGEYRARLAKTVSLYRIFGMAKSTNERVSIIRFVLRALINLPLPRRWRQRDIDVYLHGIRYFVGLSSQEIYTFDEIHHDRVYEMSADFIPQAGWTVLDIGANVGMFALPQAHRGAHVYAFEPNPDCFQRLSRSVRANNLGGRISVFNYAIGSAPGAGKMVVPQGGTVVGSVVQVSDSTAPSAPIVQITSLDHLVPSLKIGHIDLLKLDAEGAEVEVLHGASRTLEIVDRFLIEYHSEDLLSQVTAILAGYGVSPVLHIDSQYSPGAGTLYAKKPLHNLTT